MAAPNASAGKGRPPGMRGGGGWRAFLSLTVPAFCWEFLRRNPDYRQEYAQVGQGLASLDGRWGLAAFADPELTADDARVIWRADVAPGLVVPMERATFGSPRASALRRRAPIAASDGAHIRLPSGLQVLLRGDAKPTGPLVVVLAYDSDFHLRVRAVDALRRADHTDAPPHSRLTLAQRERLARSLAALDGSLRNESYRQIAEGLFEDLPHGSAFKTSSMRDMTVRLVRRGRELMSGGYLKLLKLGF